MRLDKVLANSGAGSRSEVKEYVRKGRVTVNGICVRSADTDVSDTDEILLDGRAVNASKFRYFLLNKPAGVVTATEDKYDRTVMELFPKGMPTGLAPVGRLDKDTVGLLLITNDGELAHRLLSPNRHVDKTYYAVMDGILPANSVSSFAEGIEFKEFTTEPALLEILAADEAAGKSEARVTIHEGKFHQVKRMFAAVGCEVTFLRRESFGPWSIPEGLDEGQFVEIAVDRDSIMKN